MVKDKLDEETKVIKDSFAWFVQETVSQQQRDNEVDLTSFRTGVTNLKISTESFPSDIGTFIEEKGAQVQLLEDATLQMVILGTQ